MNVHEQIAEALQNIDKSNFSVKQLCGIAGYCYILLTRRGK